MTPKNHKVLLGVTINDANIKAPRQMKKTVRSMIHRAVITGDYSLKNVICGYVSYIDSIEKGYKDKIKKYIHKYYEDPITLFKDAVDAYNKNKFYEDMPDMENRNIDFFLNGDEWDEDEVLTAFYEEREAFLKSNFDEAEAARFETGKISDKKQSELSVARAEATSIVSYGTAKFKAENKAETDEFEKAQKSRVEEEKTVLRNEAENSKDSLNNGSSEISKIIVDKVLGV